jgi:anaerobic magnesium-protoporphyrin IX monomethyl ester cyclase
MSDFSVDVLLGHSNFVAYDPKQLQKMRPYAPLTALYAAAYLRSVGYSVAIFDAMLAEGEFEFAEAVRRHRPRWVALCEDNFNFLTKMCLSRMREAACAMAKEASAAGATVIAAGPDVTDHPEFYFPHGVRFALLGEPEHSLRELLDTLSGRGSRTLEEVAGIAVADPDAPGGVRRTAKRAPERHPDHFPVPAWDLLDVERYRTAWTRAHGYYSVNMVTTRGCPFHCNWCAKPIWGQRYAMRSPADVAEELALVKRLVRPDHVWFADDIFGLRPQWVTAFAREVADREAAVPFMIQSRVDLMTDEAVAALARAGCTEVWLGAESGSQKILDAMEKGTEVAEIRRSRARLQAAGIRACFFIQFGYPGETFEDIMATVQLVRETLPDDIGVSVSYPLPGTRFHEAVSSQLGDKINWIDSDDLAMMFHGTYASPFYRHLHRLLHRDLALRRRLIDRSGTEPEDVAQELDRLNAAWFELGRLEATFRSAAPTRIPLPLLEHPAPDLSKEWN